MNGKGVPASFCRVFHETFPALHCSAWSYNRSFAKTMQTPARDRITVSPNHSSIAVKSGTAMPRYRTVRTTDQPLASVNRGRLHKSSCFRCIPPRVKLFTPSIVEVCWNPSDRKASHFKVASPVGPSIDAKDATEGQNSHFFTGLPFWPHKTWYLSSEAYPFIWFVLRVIAEQSQ